MGCSCSIVLIGFGDVVEIDISAGRKMKELDA